MMKPISLKVIRAACEGYNKDLRSDDPRFNRSVTIIYLDGSYVHYDSAFLMRVGDGLIVMFSEHHGMYINHQDELLRFYESERSHKTIEELSLHALP